MDLFAVEQIWGIFMFFLGAGVLNVCNRWERQDAEWLKDPRNKYRKRKKSDFLIPTTVRGTLMTLMGSSLSLTGITMFFLHIP